MSYWIVVPFLMFIALAQATVMPWLSIAGVKIDLALALVVAWGLLGPPGDAAIWGFVAGILLDLISGLPFGAQTLALTAIGGFLSLPLLDEFRGNLLVPPAAIVLATLVYNVFILTILSALGWQVSWDDYLVRLTLPAAIFNMLALPFLYFPLQWISRLR